HPPVRRLPRSGGERRGCAADVPRRPGDGLRHRCGPEVGEDRTLGNRRRIAAGRCCMKRTIATLVIMLAATVAAQPPTPQGADGRGRGGRGAGPRGADPLVLDDHAGFESIFDGRTLKGWDGDPAFWRVDGNTIVGQSTEQNPVKQNTFLIWRGGEPKD